MARLTAQALSGSLGQMIVDNKPGAGGTLAGREAARAEPDGYTLLFGSSAALAIGPAMYGNSGYDPVKSFAPIAIISSVPYVMIGATNAPFKTVPELMAYAKANPGKVNFGVPNGAPPHMLAEMFKMQTGADIQVVPYRGASTLITDMLAGRIHGGFETTSVMLAHLSDGHIRGLAVLRDSRLPSLPDVPTMTESGVNGVMGASWSGLLAPAGTPQPIIDRLRADTLAALKTPEFAGRLRTMSADSPNMSAEEFGAFVAAEHQRIGAIMKAAGLKAQ
ncbi:MAG: tripartite tricarboxylate transporter substrate binding protein [Xanthobacteraceae bacterium]|nr:tripartite tricarboxylate transporter substrate binding protein [Xanthobacteraceae bacterium]